MRYSEYVKKVFYITFYNYNIGNNKVAALSHWSILLFDGDPN